MEGRHQLRRRGGVHLADLLILPILKIYRKYYGAKTAAFRLGTFYLAMVIAGYIVEFAFEGLGLIPDQAAMEGVSWNYTTWLNIASLLLAAVLLVRFWRTDGLSMLRMMGGSPDTGHLQHGHPPGDTHGGHHH